MTLKHGDRLRHNSSLQVGTIIVVSEFQGLVIVGVDGGTHLWSLDECELINDQCEEMRQRI